MDQRYQTTIDQIIIIKTIICVKIIVTATMATIILTRGLNIKAIISAVRKIISLDKISSARLQKTQDA